MLNSLSSLVLSRVVQALPPWCPSVRLGNVLGNSIHLGICWDASYSSLSS